MTAQQIMKEWPTLPEEEKLAVLRFLEKQSPEVQQEIKYASSDQVQDAAAKIFAKYDDLFKKLAQ